MMAEQVCPCCLRPLPRVFDRALDRVALSPTERKIVDALSGAYPDGLSNKDIILVVYGDDPDGGPLSARNCINVHLHSIRKRIRAAGWTVGADARGGQTIRLKQIAMHNMVKRGLRVDGETLSA